MSIKLSVPTTKDATDLKPSITVIGVGGAGGNAVNNMIESGLEGVEFVVANSDAQALANSHAERRIQMGIDVTRGLGAGSNPDIGRAAAEESLEEIIGHIHHTNMLFVTAGLGGGTGTGAAPVIARAARDYGILTVGVVTKPFHFEGDRRMRLAEAGLNELQQFVDTLLIIPNQNLFYVANEQTTFADAFQMADQVLYSGVRGVTDLMVSPGLINLDFADIKSVMSEMGKAMMGTGEAEGENRATEAAEAAISNPLLDDSSMQGARGVLINITAGKDITLFEVDEAANRIRKEVDDDANIIFGSTFDEAVEGRVRVSVVATGIEAEAQMLADHEIPEITDARDAATKIEQAAEGEIAEPQEPAPVTDFPRPMKSEPAAADAVLPGIAERPEKPLYVKPKPAVTGITAPMQPAPAAEVQEAPAAARDAVTAHSSTKATIEASSEAPSARADVFIPAPPVAGNVAIDEMPKADPFTAA
ncbi:MAG: cell division protein FtsZ, partial [Rhodospirillales bacterium]|nr:cell division protein FtsZ [Rhodospirillales bacterium]